METRVFLGAPRAGKTASLVALADSLVDQGISQSEILVLAPTPDAARSLKYRLTEKNCALGAIAVRTPQEHALRLLHAHSEDPRLRSGHLLGPIEQRFLFEDMKTSGIAPRRLKAMLRFFADGLADGARFDGDWLVNDEERGTFTLLQRCLQFSNGLILPELAEQALTLLKSMKEAPQFTWVLADDFQLMSRTSQQLTERLASRGLAIAADEDAVFPNFEPRPCATGTTELIDRHGTADIVELSAPRKPCASRVEGFGTPQEEIEAAADFIETQWNRSGASFAVAAPHSAWRRAIGKLLSARGVPVEEERQIPVQRGPVSSGAHEIAARSYVLLALAADPCDDSAWRCWCGFDDPLGNSLAIAKLREQAEQIAEDPQTIHEILESLPPSESPSPSLRRVIERYQRGLDFLVRLQPLSGSDLIRDCVKCCAEEVPSSSEAAEAAHELLTSLVSHPDDSSCPHESASLLAKRMRERVAFPHFELNDAVLIGPPQRFVGTETDVLVLAGLSNGLFPSGSFFDRTRTTEDTAARMENQDRALLASCVGSARQQVRASYFTEMKLEEAEKLHLGPERIKYRDNERYARFSPSIYLTALQNSAHQTSCSS